MKCFKRKQTDGTFASVDTQTCLKDTCVCMSYVERYPNSLSARQFLNQIKRSEG